MNATQAKYREMKLVKLYRDDAMNQLKASGKLLDDSIGGYTSSVSLTIEIINALADEGIKCPDADTIITKVEEYGKTFDAPSTFHLVCNEYREV